MRLVVLHNFACFAVEIATLARVRVEGEEQDKTVIKVLQADEVNDLIRVYEKEEARKKEEKAKEEKARQEKAAASTSTTT